MEYTQNDVDSMALCAWKEARGEGETGCFFVMQVIYNRVGAPGFAKNIHDVVYGRNQFSSMSIPSDPQFNLQPAANDPIYLACLAEAPHILNGLNDEAVIRNALYYANELHITSGWYYENIIASGKHPIILQYKAHTFRA